LIQPLSENVTVPLTKLRSECHKVTCEPGPILRTFKVPVELPSERDTVTDTREGMGGKTYSASRIAVRHIGTVTFVVRELTYVDCYTVLKRFALDGS
jgi:hypothetical protein